MSFSGELAYLLYYCNPTSQDKAWNIIFTEQMELCWFLLCVVEIKIKERGGGERGRGHFFVHISMYLFIFYFPKRIEAVYNKLLTV